jgi:acyl-CoA thioesterase
VTDAYYELIDPDDPLGEKFTASDHVISTWGSTMQNAAPVSALLVRALERCSPRADTRLSRVVVDLLGPVPVTVQLWVRARVDRPGTKIELLSADLVVHIHRVPEGDWIGVRAETRYGRDGVGASVGTLFDEQGSIAAIQQAQLVRRR